MVKFEYKTLTLNFHAGLFRRSLPDIKTALDKEGQQGWQLKQMLLPQKEWGMSDMVAILERAIDPPK